MARAGSAARRGMAWPRCGSPSATGRRRSKTWTGRRTRFYDRSPEIGTELLSRERRAEAAPLQQRTQVEVGPLAERLGEVAQHEQHRAVEAVVHDDRDAVPVGSLEELVLDAQDPVEVREVLVRGALALAGLARREARRPRVAVERRDDEEDHVGALLVGRERSE